MKNSPQPSPSDFDYDLAIVGGGIVGTTLAAALRDSGLRVVLIEQSTESAAVAKGRAYAISLMSGRIFEGIGIWAQIFPQINTFSQISLSDGEYPQVVRFAPQELRTQGLGYAAEHKVLLTALQGCLKDCPNISWLCPAEVISIDYQADAAELSIELKQVNLSTKIRTRLVIAADGARSRIRAAAGINTRGWHYWQSCVVATIKPEKFHENIAYERFWPSGPMGVLPLPGNRCQVVWTAPHEEAKTLQDVDEKEFLAELERRTAGLLGKLELIGSRYIFPVQLMQSDRYVMPRLALIGDAAHCCHPVAGQGMNLGIRDAAAIAQVLRSAHQQGEDIGSIGVLKRYEHWRKRENLVILACTDVLDRIFSNNWLLLVLIRRLGLWMLQLLHPFRIYALQLMTGLRGRHPELARR